MRRVLFVDDDPNVLAGLRDMLRKQRRKWDMVFAPGGPDAIEELQKGSFDVVVTDMRMPQIDGAALLAYLRENHPATARIVLSGHAEKDAAVRALPLAHQFVSKPCDSERLRVVIERACELQSLLAAASARELIGKLDRLPSSPQTYFELAQAAAHKDSGLGDLASIVERDPAMTVRVLQLVNSGYFGLPKQVTSVNQAVAYLGADMLRSLALSAHAFGTCENRPILGFSIEKMQSLAIASARIAKKILGNTPEAQAAFTAAMVHDVGELVLMVGVPQVLEQVHQQALERGCPAYEVERELLGVTHAEVGGYLLGMWGLPLEIVEAVSYHHAPSQLAEGPCDVLASVHLADALTQGYAPDMRFLERAGLADRIDELSAMAQAVLST